MKKGVLWLMTIVLMTACQPSVNKQDEACVLNNVKVYTGTLPAADCPGIEYKLSINGDTVFSLDRTYLEAIDGRDTTFVSNGKVESLQEGNAIKLVTEDEVIYFKVVNDSTLRMVNDSLQEIQTPLNYDIVKVK